MNTNYFIFGIRVKVQGNKALFLNIGSIRTAISLDTVKFLCLRGLQAADVELELCIQQRRCRLAWTCNSGPNQHHDAVRGHIQHSFSKRTCSPYIACMLSQTAFYSLFCRRIDATKHSCDESIVGYILGRCLFKQQNCSLVHVRSEL